MRIMLVMAIEANETAEGAIDLDRVLFAHAKGDNTLVFINDNISIHLAMPFDVFLGYWSQDKVINLPNAMTKSVSVEDVIKEEVK